MKNRRHLTPAGRLWLSWVLILVLIAVTYYSIGRKDAPSEPVSSVTLWQAPPQTPLPSPVADSAITDTELYAVPIGGYELTVGAIAADAIGATQIASDAITCVVCE